MGESEEIKEKIDIVEFINEFVPLKRAGRNFKALCPFHSEKTPSFIVSPERQIWYCFGACHEGGDIFKFLMKWENLEFPEALRELAKRAGVKLKKWEGQETNWKMKERLYEINHLASEYYHYLLRKHKIGEAGRAYLKKRGIKEKIVKTFLLGYAPLGFDNLLSFLKRKGYREEEIEKAGLIIKGKRGYYDRFRGRLIFTLRDHRENIVGFSGRLLSEEKKEAKYINTPETLLYHKSRLLYGLEITREAIRKEKKAIITEGEFDVLSSFQAGIANVVAIKGTALTQDQLKLLRRFSSEILLALDMDLAGDAAARRSIELADRFGFNIKIVKIPQGKDLDEALRKKVLSVKQALKKASSIYDFILHSALKRFGREDAFSKKKISEEVIPFYAKITNPIVRNHYAKKLAKKLEVSEEAVVEEIENNLRYQKSNIKYTRQKSKVNKEKRSREEILEEYLLSLILQSAKPKEVFKILAKSIKIEELKNPAIKKVLTRLREWKGETMTKFAQTLPQELLDIFNRASLRELNPLILKDKKKFQKEFEKTVKEVRKMILRRKLKFLATKIKTKEEENLEKLNQEFKKLSSKLKEIEK